LYERNNCRANKIHDESSEEPRTITKNFTERKTKKITKKKKKKKKQTKKKQRKKHREKAKYIPKLVFERISIHIKKNNGRGSLHLS